MTLTDRQGLPLSTSEPAARDAYDLAIERFLGAEPGVAEALDRALAADPGLALAEIARARLLQVLGEGAAARAAAGRAVALAAGATPREQGHVVALERVVAGDRAGALAAVQAHLRDHPRDLMVFLPLAGVFGLIGFSGEAGRERRLLELLAGYEPALGDDGCFLTALAFAEAELGLIEPARARIERALALNPRNANAAHVRAHVHYEAGEAEAGLDWLEGWFAGYGRDGLMHCHLGWHLALWNLDLGRNEKAWQAYAALVEPAGEGLGLRGEQRGGKEPGAWGPPLNVLTDAASFLFRAELAGGARDAARWQGMADYARRRFPTPGLAFADAHAALAYAMAGAEDDLAALLAGARGPAGDLVVALGRGFAAYARGDWAQAQAALAPACREHERLGGSRAQRDLIEQAAAAATRHAGGEARTHRLPRG